MHRSIVGFGNPVIDEIENFKKIKHHQDAIYNARYNSKPNNNSPFSNT